MSAGCTDDTPALPALKLTYFKVRGRAELTRLVFAAGAVAYEDERVAIEEQRRRKAAGELPFGQFPTLAVGGNTFAQSYSIAKYASKIAGLMPAEPLVALAVESIVDTTDDVRTKLVPIRYMPISPSERLAKYTDFFQKILPPLLANFERLCPEISKGGYLVGDSLTLADLAVFNMCDYLTFPNCEVLAASEEHLKMAVACIDECPKLKAHRERIASLPRIADWVARRPKTPHDNVVTLSDADFA